MRLPAYGCSASTGFALTEFNRLFSTWFKLKVLRPLANKKPHRTPEAQDHNFIAKLIFFKRTLHQITSRLVSATSFRDTVAITDWCLLELYACYITNPPTDLPEHRYKRHRFPAEIIVHAVWPYHPFQLSPRDFEDLLAERRIDVSFRTVSEWAVKFWRQFADHLRGRS